MWEPKELRWAPQLGWWQRVGLTTAAGSTSVPGWGLYATIYCPCTWVFFSVGMFYKYFGTHSLVLWKVSFRNYLWCRSSLYVWPSGLTPSRSFAYLLIPSKVDCGVFWSPAVELVFSVMDDISVSCLLLLTFHLLSDLKFKTEFTCLYPFLLQL